MPSKIIVPIEDAPDGTYKMIVDLNDGTRVTREDATFSGGTTTINLASTNVGVGVKGYLDDNATPSLRGAYFQTTTVAQ